MGEDIRGSPLLRLVNRCEGPSPGQERSVVRGVGGGEGADGFDGGSELRFCGVGVPWAGAGVGSCVVGE